MTETTNKIAVTIPEACALSGLGRSSIYEAFKSRRLIARKHGKRTLILVRDLREYLENLPTSVS
jgi:excisionase family DNA binding protein